MLPPSTCNTYIPSPNLIKNSKGVLNIHNKDDKCFVWGILSSLFTVNSKDWHSYVKFIPKLNFDGMNFPTRVQDVDTFESNNPDISVDVYGYNEQEDRIYAIRVTPEKQSRHVKLLRLSNGGKKHYTAIRNVRHLMCHITRHRTNSFFCDYCLRPFVSKNELEDHSYDCISSMIRSPSFKRQYDDVDYNSDDSCGAL